jgi:uncharacterized membrane protein YkvA (DUF1232 family)
MKNSRLKNLSKKVLDSDVFKKAQKEAQSYITDEKKLKELLGKAETKSENVHTNKLTFLNKIRVLIRMLNAYRKGDYKIIPWQSLVFITAGIIYFISPIDFLPDFIPFLGFTDDASIILFIFNSLNPDIQKFLDWESEK